MSAFKDTGGKLRFDYFEKMVNAEALWEQAKKAGQHVLADKYHKDVLAYAAMLTAVSVTT